jgi:hypothetical protein
MHRVEYYVKYYANSNPEKPKKRKSFLSEDRAIVWAIGRPETEEAEAFEEITLTLWPIEKM